MDWKEKQHASMNFILIEGGRAEESSEKKNTGSERNPFDSIN